jgi:hypothetical protein
MTSTFTLSSLSRLLPDTSEAYLKGFLDDRCFQEKRDAERADEASLKPPAEVVAIAKRALKMTEEGKLKPGDGMEVGTKQWVTKIANGEPVSLEKARKGWRWFKRNSRFAGEPQDSPAYAAWMYWFGSPGRSWFNRLAREYGFGDDSGAEKEDYRGSGRRDSDRMDKRRPGSRSSNRGITCGGHVHWVKDPRVKDGGYCRKNPDSSLHMAEAPSEWESADDATKLAVVAGLGLLGGGIAGFALSQFMSQQGTETLVRRARTEAEAAANKQKKEYMAKATAKMQEQHEREMAGAVKQAKESVQAESNAEFERRVQAVEERAFMAVESRARKLADETIALSQAEFNLRLERQAEEIRANVHSEAQKQIVAERMKAQAAAREEILQKTAPPGKKGTVLVDERQGIALGASIQQGLDFQNLPENRQKGRIRDAVDRLGNRRAADGLRDLHMDFNREIRDFIREPVSTGERVSQKRTAEIIMNRWGQLSDMLGRQGARENVYVGKVNQIKGSAKTEYMEMWEQLRERGYSESAIVEFDRKSAALSGKLLKSISEAVDDTRNRNPLTD